MKDKLNNTSAGLKLLKKKMVLLLLLAMGLASATIIIVNFYSVRVLSGVRAYASGESAYSKGQKDASAYLINYISTGNEQDYAAFQRAISIPEGAHIARISLSGPNVDFKLASEGMLQGKSHPDDIGNMIWLFMTFKRFGPFEKAINIWKDGDAMISELDQLGYRAHTLFISGSINETRKAALMRAIKANMTDLTGKEEAFSNTIGDISRKIRLYVFLFDVLTTLVIVISSLCAAAIMIRNLANSKKQIIEQNESLQLINAGLDKFVFNVTHDLRSPLAAMSGLIDLIDDESDIKQIREYTLMLKESLEKQDRFIKEMLTFVKSKHTGVAKDECSLDEIVNNVIAQNNYQNKGQVKFYKELELTQIISDELKLQVILNNLVSNSIKYRDQQKPERWVKVKSYRVDSLAVIEVEDNGLGIRQKDQDRIFDKFYMSGDNKKSTGLGLYLVKDAVSQLSGKIEVQSEPGVSSNFKVSIPFS